MIWDYVFLTWLLMAVTLRWWLPVAVDGQRESIQVTIIRSLFIVLLGPILVGLTLIWLTWPVLFWVLIYRSSRCRDALEQSTQAPIILEEELP